MIIKNVLLKLSFLLLIRGIFIGDCFAATENLTSKKEQSLRLENNTQAVVKSSWPFKMLVVGAQEIDGLDKRVNVNCPSSKYLQGNFQISFIAPGLTAPSDFPIFQLYFDDDGRVLDPRTRKITNWYGNYEVVKNGVAKISLAKQGCNQRVEIGFYNPQTSRLCEQINQTSIKYKKPSALKYSFDSCTDWSKVLDDRSKKSIDVTSDDGADEIGAYISTFIGFYRFNDDVKPVIGKLGETWFCLLNCPSRKPGIIQKD